MPTKIIIAATATVAIAATVTAAYKAYPIVRDWRIRKFAERTANQTSILDTEDIRGEILEEHPVLIVQEADKPDDPSDGQANPSNQNDAGDDGDMAIIYHGNDPRAKPDRHHRVRKGRLARALAQHLRQFTVDGFTIDLRVARHEGYKWFKGTTVRPSDREPILCAAMSRHAHPWGLVTPRFSDIARIAKQIMPTKLILAATATVAVAATVTAAYKAYPIIRDWRIRKFAERNANQISILDTEDLRGEILEEHPVLVVQESDKPDDPLDGLASLFNQVEADDDGEIPIIYHGNDPRAKPDRHHRVRKGRLARALAQHLRQFTTDGYTIDLRVARHEGYKWFKGTSVRHADREPLLCAAIAIVSTPSRCHRELASYQQRSSWVDWIVTRGWDPRT
jgi:hypothetical protein